MVPEARTSYETGGSPTRFSEGLMISYPGILVVLTVSRYVYYLTFSNSPQPVRSIGTNPTFRGLAPLGDSIVRNDKPVDYGVYLMGL